MRRIVATSMLFLLLTGGAIGALPPKAMAGSSQLKAENPWGNLNTLESAAACSLVLVGGYDTPDLANGVSVVGSVVYVADGVSGLLAIDVSDPTSPDTLGSFYTSGFARRVAVVPPHAFVADDIGLLVIDISDPTQMSLAGGDITTTMATDVEVVGNRAYVTFDEDHQHGLVVFDITDPALPTRIGNRSFANAEHPKALAVDGGYAYVGFEGGTKFRVLDLATNNPGQVHTQGMNAAIVGMDVFGQELYVCLRDSLESLVVFGVTDPTSPSQIGSVASGSLANDVLATSGQAYLVTDAGLHVFDVTVPQTPLLVKSYATPAAARGVAVVGDTAYVGAASTGILILTCGQQADVGVDKTVDLSAPNHGDVVTFLISLSNAGPDSATGVIVSDALPAGLTYLSDAPDQGSYDDVTGLWDVGALPVDSVTTLQLVAAVNIGTSGSTLVNSAIVVALDQPDFNSANDSATVEVTVLPSSCLPPLVSKVQPTKQLPQELATLEPFIDVVGPATTPAVSKATPDTVWIADWSFDEGGACSSTGWTTVDERILNDGSVYWDVNSNFGSQGNIQSKAAVCTNHDLCWVFPDGYGNDWYQAIRIEYTGASYLSFDYLIDSEAGFDFLSVEVDSACASFDLVDYQIDPAGTAATFRDILFSTSGYDISSARVDSLPLCDFENPQAVHCVYLSFLSDAVFSPEDGLQPTLINAAVVIDNLSLEPYGGSTTDIEENFEGVLHPAVSFVNLADSEPFGNWARVYKHATDNDVCTENLTCSIIWTDPTLTASDPGMGFGPNGSVIRNWLDNSIISPWSSLLATQGASGTVLSFRRFPGNFQTTSRIVQGWSVRGKYRIDNTDTPALGDSVDCISPWGHASSWNSLSYFAWVTNIFNMGGDFPSSSTEIQVRFRVSDWQWVGDAGEPPVWNPGPGPYTDRVRIGRLVFSGPEIIQGIDARYQAQDCAPTRLVSGPAPEPNYHMEDSSSDEELFGTSAFSRSSDLGINNQTSNLILGDSLTVNVFDTREAGGVQSVGVYGTIVRGPHAGKAPPPWTVDASGFFYVSANPTPVEDRWSVDLDDEYFRGGDELRYFWFATDNSGGMASLPTGLTSVPSSLQEAEIATGGLFEVSYLPAINWDPAYLARIATDPSGKLSPTALEIANSSQAHCILYYQNVNSRRRSGDSNRTSFMYALDRLGYRDQYDVFDHMGLGNTNNQLGSRMTVSQARNYSLIVYDAGNRSVGAPILPDGLDIDSEKIKMEAWFQGWLSNANLPEVPTHSLWFLASNALEEKPASALYSMMGVGFIDWNQSSNVNPDIEGTAAFAFSDGDSVAFSGDTFTLQGGCPNIRHYDALDASGTGVVTHRWKDRGTLGDAAIVMNANSTDDWNSILMAFPWFDIRDPQPGPSDPQAEDLLASKILNRVLSGGCAQVPGTTNVPNLDNTEDFPQQSALYANSPNPFNPRTTIRYDIAETAHVRLFVYDVAGRLVRSLVDEYSKPGRLEAVWDGLDNNGRRVATGVYFYKLEANDFEATRKLVVMK